MKACIENYINGNLADAKRQARKFSQLRLYLLLRKEYDKGHSEAMAITNFLKSKGTWQAACDAGNKEK